jgi:hypothetical protein
VASFVDTNYLLDEIPGKEQLSIVSAKLLVFVAVDLAVD